MIVEKWLEGSRAWVAVDESSPLYGMEQDEANVFFAPTQMIVNVGYVEGKGWCFEWMSKFPASYETLEHFATKITTLENNLAKFTQRLIDKITKLNPDTKTALGAS